MSPLVGRERERRTFTQALRSSVPELVAVYGRRRIGKTFLVRQLCAEQLVFELVGSHDGTRAVQLEAFAATLAEACGSSLALPNDWPEAFGQLVRYLEPLLKAKRGKRVLFFDELPWLATRRSGFLQAFEHFWNSWASRQARLLVVICGSSASWMLRKVIRQRGGLHNRITRRLRLDPFTLRETECLLEAGGVHLGRYQVLQLYMALGGVPHYLAQVEPGESAAQAIDRLCFGRGGALRDEFVHLYEALFIKPERHEAVVRALAKKRRGLNRNELLQAAGLDSGGAATQVIDELIESGFVMATHQHGYDKRGVIHRLADPYSLFYLRFVERHRGASTGAWLAKHRSPSFKAWSGLTFETIALTHAAGIKAALGIAGVSTQLSAWHHRASETGEDGAQIDLVIERADHTTNLCELKFADADFTIDKRYARELRNKRATFERVTRTRDTLITTLVTTYGVRDNLHAQALGIASVSMDALFEARELTW
jgi:uncharacterized protein